MHTYSLPNVRHIREATDADETLQKGIDYTVSGWPRHAKDIDVDTRELFHVRDEITVIKGLLVRNQNIVIYASMRAEILLKIHESHQRVTGQSIDMVAWLTDRDKQLRETLWTLSRPSVNSAEGAPEEHSIASVYMAKD